MACRTVEVDFLSKADADLFVVLVAAPGFHYFAFSTVFVGLWLDSSTVVVDCLLDLAMVVSGR